MIRLSPESTLPEDVQNRKKRPVASAIRFVSAAFLQDNGLDEQENEQKCSDVRLWADDEEQNAGSVRKERNLDFMPQPKRMVTVLKREHQEA